MADRPLDVRFERLVALLYGELPPAEERSLRAEIESDPALRAAWEEISSAREFLGRVPEEPAPSFVFLDESHLPARRRLSRFFPVLAPWAAAACLMTAEPAPKEESMR
jgi:anti-sigma factor RsiW